MLPRSIRDSVKTAIQELRLQHHVFGEVKWGTVSSNKLDFYIDLVDLFFSLDDVTFRSIVIDASKVCNNVYNNNDHELGYYKFYYQLLVHWLFYQHSYWIYTDQKTNRERKRLQETKRIVNLGFNGTNPIESIQAIDSKESLIMQWQNVIMGAVGYRFNFPNGGLSSAKNAIVNRIEHNLGHKIMPTTSGVKKFNVFAISLREA